MKSHKFCCKGVKKLKFVLKRGEKVELSAERKCCRELGELGPPGLKAATHLTEPNWLSGN